MGTGVVGVGYEGRSVGEFLGLVQDQRVQVLVDARLIPRCSRRGFSRNALAECLETIGVSYVHYEVLGVPEFDQVGFRGDPASVAGATSRYRARLNTPAAQRVIRDLVAVSRHRRVAVMTMFADAARCHRATLMAEIERRTPVAKPIDEMLAEFARPAERTDEHSARPAERTDEHSARPAERTDKHSARPAERTDEHGPAPEPAPVFDADPRSQVERDIDALLAEVDAGKR